MVGLLRFQPDRNPDPGVKNGDDIVFIINGNDVLIETAVGELRPPVIDQEITEIQPRLEHFETGLAVEQGAEVDMKPAVKQQVPQVRLVA